MFVVDSSKDRVGSSMLDMVGMINGNGGFGVFVLGGGSDIFCRLIAAINL